jgi:hypothetical protein
MRIELERESEFRSYLQGVTRNVAVQRDNISRCRTVSEHEGSIFNHYLQDKGKALLDRLIYTTSDERSGAEQRHSIPIDGNIRTGTASYKAAVKRYFDFLKQQG